MQQCITCQRAKPHFKCKYCGSRYCCVRCYQKHKKEDADTPEEKEKLCITICEKQKPQREKEETLKRERDESDIFSDAWKRKHLEHHNHNENENSNNTNKNTSLEEEDADGILYILSHAHLRALENDTEVTKPLRSHALQQLLKSIDRSKSRLDALEAALHSNYGF
ncbi:hypothetical protein AGDE_02842 [Angomonas deanei]|nr:hypothetical protein AGDE_02842 [Angomonas deanei]|eukprot:EPY41083.1 hypothetical protein AGDE_02842 [Angomonas deanei]